MTINDREASQPRLNNTVARRFRRRAEEAVVGGPPRLPHRREAWCYKRLSSQEQRKNSLWSLAEQDNLEELARREGYAAPLDAEGVAALKAAPDFPGHYVNGQVHVEERDIGLSGTKNHRFRPGLAALIEAIAAGRVEAVYVVHISRLYRDQTLIDAMTFADLCKRHKVVIVTPQLAFDLNQDFYFDLYKMEVENAVRELKLMKLRLHGSRLLKARHGYYDGRGVAWGYILDLDRGSPTYQKLVPYEPHAAIVREIFRLALVHRAARAVRQHLLDRELFFPPFPPEVAEMLAGRHCRKTCRLRPDGSWLPRNQAVLSILTNPVYIGWWLVRGEVVSRANHPPLVDEQTFWAVQEIWNPIDYRSGDVNPSYSANAGRAVGRRSLLTGRLYCGRHPEDGEWSRHYLCASRGGATKGGRPADWYICSLDYERDNRRPACFHSRQEVIDRAVVDHVLRRVSLVDVAREVVDRLEEEHRSDRANSRRDRALCEQLQREIDGLKGKLPWAETRADYDLLMGELRWRERQIERLSRPSPAHQGRLTVARMREVMAFLRALPERWEQLSHQSRRWFLAVLLDRITVYHDGSPSLVLHLRRKTGLVDMVQAERLHPPRPAGWRWDDWEDNAIRARYPTCEHVDEVLSRIKPFRNWVAVKRRACELGIYRASPRPPFGVAEHSRPT